MFVSSMTNFTQKSLDITLQKKGAKVEEINSNWCHFTAKLLNYSYYFGFFCEHEKKTNKENSILMIISFF